MTKEWRKRPRCLLLGCVLGEHDPCCYYCGEGLYEDFIQTGKLDPLFGFCWRARQFIRGLSPITHCDECGKRIYFGRPYAKDFCSEACHDNWLPF